MAGLTDEDTLRWLTKRHPVMHEMLQSLITALKRRKTHGSHATATSTTLLLRNMLGICNFETASDAIRTIRCVGRTLLDAQPREVAVGSAVRRVLFLIREYKRKFIADHHLAHNHKASQPDNSLLSPLRMGSPKPEAQKPVDFMGLRNNILDDIKDTLVPELEGLSSATSPIYECAKDFIHNKEVILTFGYSKTVENFLTAAAWGWNELQKHGSSVGLATASNGSALKRSKKKRDFEVIVAESAPGFEGQQVALNLANAGIETTVITDSAVFALMARVNKVIVGCHAIMADGGLIAQAGMQMVALAAKHHRVPLVCISGLYKLSPLYRHSNVGGATVLNHVLSPSPLLGFDEFDFNMDKAEVLNPAFDSIPANLVDLIVTDSGSVTPSYVYRLLQENFSSEDYSLEEKHVH